MKVFLLKFAGEYLGGEMIIFAETKAKAFNTAKDQIAAMSEKIKKSNANITIDDLEELDSTKRSAYVIDDGDY